MYTKEQLKDLLKERIKDFEQFDKYYAIYQYHFQNNSSIETKKYHFHHCIPVNVTKQNLNKKNRRQVIAEHDNKYNVEDNIVKLPIKWHIVAHYVFALATKNIDDINAFYTLVEDFETNINSYTFDSVVDLAKIIEENAKPNSKKQYMTVEQVKKQIKQKQNNYKQELKQKMKPRQEEYKKQLKEHKKQLSNK